MFFRGCFVTWYCIPAHYSYMPLMCIGIIVVFLSKCTPRQHANSARWSGVYPCQLGTSPQWRTRAIFFSRLHVKTCVGPWVKLTSTGWARNSSRSCGVRYTRCQAAHVAPRVTYQVVANGFRRNSEDGRTTQPLTMYRGRTDDRW